MKPPPPIHQLTITLLAIEPSIWRRLQVPASIKLCCLHSAIQVVMGWKDTHLHNFRRDGKCWGVPIYDEFDESNLIAETKTQLAELLKAEGDSLTYVYDFGDNWEHEVILEKIIPTNAPLKRPICLDGARRCPPEDVGGVLGYERFLELIFDPTCDDYADIVGWAGGHFHGEEFDLEAVNEKLGRMQCSVRHRR